MLEYTIWQRLLTENMEQYNVLRLARKADISPSHCIKIVRKMESAGLITVTLLGRELATHLQRAMKIELSPEK